MAPHGGGQDHPPHDDTKTSNPKYSLTWVDFFVALLLVSGLLFAWVVS